MKNIYKNILALLALIVAASCNDLLDQEVAGKLPEGQFYQTDEDLMYATIAVYDGITNAYSTGSWSSLYLLKMMPSDESNAGGSDPNDQLAFQNVDDFTHDSENSHILGVWNRLYSAVKRANNVIHFSSGESGLQKRLIAEAKTLRAYLYMELVALWGDLPLVVEAIEDPQEYYSIERASKASVYAQIEKDLIEAIPDLPDKSAYDAADKFRVAKGTAQGLLGKAYLRQEKWPEAAAVLETVMASGEYDLENNVSDVFLMQNEFGKESLFEVNLVSTEEYDWNNFPWGTLTESNIIVQLMGPREGSYVKAPSDSLVIGWGFNTPTQKIWDAFVAAGDVSRRRQTIMSEEELVAAGGSITPTWKYEGFIRRKYGTFESQTAGPITALNYGTNFMILRYADVLLMAAEANYRNDNEEKAREYLNEVRQRPGTNLPLVTASGDALFEAIVTERMLELAFEGDRFIDLVRWGRAAQELGPLGFKAGKHEVLPIPNNDVISAGLSQNPNY